MKKLLTGSTALCAVGLQIASSPPDAIRGSVYDKRAHSAPDLTGGGFPMKGPSMAPPDMYRGALGDSLTGQGDGDVLLSNDAPLATDPELATRAAEMLAT